MNELKSLLAYGNKKLPKSTAIFNLGSATFCPSKFTNQCKVSEICYALKSERQYKQVLGYRMRQLKYYNSNSAYQFIEDFIEAIKHKAIKVTHLRINESGDFATQNQVNKLICIAQLLKHYSIKVYVYTANDMLDYSNLMKVAIVNGSNEMYSNRFKVVDKINTNKVYCIADCTKCNICTFKLKATIQVLKH